ncbi:MAG: hypothetical protein JRJ44_04740 [Deltaproteobacteria bacterium]|nr:hypothetical protein [Deltaproteobacteria bacterium]
MRNSRLILKLFIAIILLLSSIYGCAVIRVSGNPSISSHYGILNVKPQCSGDIPTLITVEGLGAFFGAKSFTLGYNKELIITAPDINQSRIFIVVESKEELNSLKKFLSQNKTLITNPFVFTKKGETWKNQNTK